MLLVLVAGAGLTAGTGSAQAFVPVDRVDFARSGIEGSDSEGLFKLLNLVQFSEETTPTHVLVAKSFILHIDEYEDLDDLGILERAEAQAKNLLDPEESICPVVIENSIYPAVGAYEITLGFDEELFSQEPTPTPRIDIYAFIVDDDTPVDHGVVFFAEDFELAFSERSELTTETVKESASARAFYIETGSDISCQILIDEEKLADFAQSDCLEPFEVTLSVPATVPAEMLLPSDAVDEVELTDSAYLSDGELVSDVYPVDVTFEEAPLASVTVQIITIDDRPEQPRPPLPPLPPRPEQPPFPQNPERPPLGDGGLVGGGTGTGTGGGNNAGSGNGSGSGTAGGNGGGNNAGGNDTGGTTGDGSTAGTAGTGGTGDNSSSSGATGGGSGSSTGPAVLGSAPGTGQGVRPSSRPSTPPSSNPAENAPTTTQSTSSEEGSEDGDDAAQPEQAAMQTTPGTAEANPLPITADTGTGEEGSAQGSNIFLILGIVLALVAVAAAGYLTYQQFFKKDPEVVI